MSNMNEKAVGCFKMLIGAACIIAAITFVVMLVKDVLKDADKAGWVYHDKLIRVAASRWASGEYKACTIIKSDSSYLICEDASDMSDMKVFKVRFYGPPKPVTLWRCRKLGDDPTFSCKNRASK